MADLRTFSSTSNIVRFTLTNSSTGLPLTGLTSTSSGLIISTIADVEATAVAYTQAGSTIETITTLGTFATPTATKCRFKEVDATNHPGLYEFQFADARFAVSNAKRLVASVPNITGLTLQGANYEIELLQINIFDAVRAGLTALPNVASGSDGSVMVRGATQDVTLKSLAISNSAGDALALTSSGSNGHGINASGNGTGSGIKGTGGATGRGIYALGGATSGAGIRAEAAAGTSHGLHAMGVNGGTGFMIDAGATGPGVKINGGATSGDGIDILTTSGDGIAVTPTAGNGLVLTANGTSKHGLVATGGTAGTSDGVKAVAGSGGVPIRGDITGNVTGTLSGAVGSVTGSVGSVTSRVTANTDQFAGQTVTAAAGVTLPASVASPTNITAGTITTVTNLANAPTSGDFTATMKTSLNAATPAVTVSDKTGFSLTTLESSVLHSGTAQAGGATSITLTAGASATDSLYTGEVVKVYGGTGAAQARVITAYVGSTKVATVDRAWATNPDNTSTYAVLALSLAKLDSSLQVVAASVQGNVTGSVASVTARVTANTDQFAGQTVTAAAGVTLPASVASPTNITAGTITTTTNLTNAPTSGDFTSTMKTSLNAATPAVTVSDKTGFSLSSGGVQALWDALTSALTTTGSIGKLLVDNINATISSRLATAGYTAPDNTSITAIKAKTDNLPASPAAVGSAMTLTSAYDPAKTASQAGDAMALTSGERTTLAGVIWANVSRTLTSFSTVVTDTATAVWSASTRVLTAGTNIALAKGSGVTGFNDLDAAAVRTAVGLASANLDTQLDALPTNAELATALSAYGAALPGAAMTLTSGERLALADTIMRRHTADIESSGNGDTINVKSLYGAIALSTHKHDTSTHANKLTIFKADGTTELVQLTTVTDNAAEPLVSVGG